MSERIAVKMLEEVVTFRVATGSLPAWAEKADWAEAAEERLNKRLQKLFQSGADRVIAEVKRRGMPGTDMALDHLTDKALGELSKGGGAALAEEASAVGASSARSAAGQAAAAGMRIKFSGPQAGLLNRLKDFSLTASPETIRKLKGDVGQILRDVAAEGLSIDDAAKRLSEAFDGLRNYQLKTIARTEIQSAQNTAAEQTMKELGVEYKQWLSASDPSVRDSHAELHGMVMRMDEPFPNGLMFPGDRSGPIGEWINCRCRQRPYIPKPGEVITVTPYIP